jgi:hypothetical protein
MFDLWVIARFFLVWINVACGWCHPYHFLFSFACMHFNPSWCPFLFFWKGLPSFYRKQHKFFDTWCPFPSATAFIESNISFLIHGVHFLQRQVDFFVAEATHKSTLGKLRVRTVLEQEKLTYYIVCSETSERTCSLVVTRAPVAPQVLDSTPRGSEFLRI